MDKNVELPRLLATSVVRGSQQGDSHGGVYSIDFSRQEIIQHLDWNTTDIDFKGRGWDRGLRGIEFFRQKIFIAASDELFVYNPQFQQVNSYRNRYLKHCHEIARMGNMLFLTSTGFDSLLGFDLGRSSFSWGLYISRDNDGFRGQVFDPLDANGPTISNELHLNNVHVDNSGMYCSGLRTESLLYVDEKFNVRKFSSLPSGAHNAQPFSNGLLFNDTAANCVRYVDRTGANKVFPVPIYPEEKLEFSGVDDSRVARQGFGRGLCTFAERFVIAGSSPSTVTVYDLHSGDRVASVNLTMDVRNAIHGLEVWPD